MKRDPKKEAFRKVEELFSENGATRASCQLGIGSIMDEYPEYKVEVLLYFRKLMAENVIRFAPRHPYRDGRK